MNHLALDIGITTGYAVHNIESGALIAHGIISEKTFEEELKDLLLKFMPRSSTAEMPVIIRGDLGNRLQDIAAAMRRVLMRQVEEIGPSMWKTHPLSKYPLPKDLSVHTKDAIRIGLWALTARLKEV